MKCTPQKTIVSRLGGGGPPGEAERVADVVGDVLHLGHLVVVREDHGVALGRERAHLVLQASDLLTGESAGPGPRWAPSAGAS